MGKSTKDGRRKSGSMPTVRIDRKNKQARVFIGGKQHHLGRVEGGKISPAQAAEAARIWYQFLNGTPEVIAPPEDTAKGPTIAELCSAYQWCSLFFPTSNSQQRHPYTAQTRQIFRTQQGVKDCQGGRIKHQLISTTR